jgi:predicted dehydrogenase
VISSSAPLRVGIVGSGGMAEYHVKKFAALPGVAIAACCDRREDRARAFAQRLGIPRWFPSAAEMAGSSEVDCMAEAVADEGHMAAALAALERRIPLFAEKPLARSLADAQALLAAARAAGVPAMVNFSKRNVPALALARRLVAEGTIGAVRGGSFSYLQSWLLQDSWGRWDRTPRWRWRVSPETSTEGIIGDLASHLFDAVRFVLGELDAVSCAATTFTADPVGDGRPGAPDACSALLRTATGAVITTRASWRAAGSLDCFAFQIEGDSGTLAADFSSSRTVLRHFDCGTGTWTVIEAGGCPSTYELFIDSARSGQTASPNFEDGVAVQHVIEACARSQRESRLISLTRQE